MYLLEYLEQIKTKNRRMVKNHETFVKIMYKSFVVWPTDKECCKLYALWKGISTQRKSLLFLHAKRLMINKITTFVDKTYYFKSLNSTSLEPSNQNSIKRNQKNFNKTSGTSVIYSSMSSPFLAIVFIYIFWKTLHQNFLYS